jgi:hypothetical protein
MHDANMYQTNFSSRFLIIAKFLLFETNAYDFLLLFTFQIFSQTMQQNLCKMPKIFLKPLVKLNRGVQCSPFSNIKKTYGLI